jgi:hypothetical protein
MFHPNVHFRVLFFLLYNNLLLFFFFLRILMLKIFGISDFRASIRVSYSYYENVIFRLFKALKKLFLVIVFNYLL